MMLTAVLILLGAFSALALPVEKNDITKGDDSYFLPNNVILPEKYQITIDVLKSFENIKDRKFIGAVIITASVNADNVKEIKLHAEQITIKGNIKVESSGTEYFESKTFDAARDFLILKLNKPLANGQRITITIDYEGVLQDNMYGFYVSTYQEKNTQKTILTTQFQATHARKAFPCFDEPKYKAQFELTFKKPKEYKVISNMLSNEADHGRDVETVTFPATPKMSPYLVAFIVHQFESVPSPDNANYNVWARPEAINQTNWAKDYVYKIVQSLNKFTNINYDKYMKKMDLAAIPDFSAGAMENWGLLTYRETALLVDEDLSTNNNIQSVVAVIAHETAHQWFGDLITTEWWMNTWLNEGFATYFEYHTTGNVTKGWQMNDQFVVDVVQGVFGVDALVQSTPLTHPVYTPQEVSSHFGSISYSKGGSVIRMMEHFLGHDIFQRGLQHYLKQNEFKNTVPDDLFAALQYVIDEQNVDLEYPIRRIMSNWVSKAGYPVINVSYNSTGYVHFSQHRFFLNPEENTKQGYNTRWYVPISYTTSEEMNFKNLKPRFWLPPNDLVQTVETGDIDYIIVNIQETGYYRVNYNELLWQRLAEALSTKAGQEKIHYINRAQIVDDVMNLARAGLVNYTIAFNVTDYLASETDYFPWNSAFRAFRFLLQRYSDNEDTGIELRTYLKNKTSLLVEDKEFLEDKPKETHIQILNKRSALEWACNLGHDKCVTQAKEMFQAFKKNNKPIPRNLRSIVYCTGLRSGNKNDWDFLWNKFRKSNSAAEKTGILNALGCSNDEKILKDYLNKSIDPKSGIRKQEGSYVFSAVYTGNSIGVDVAFDFLSNHHQDIIDNYRGLNDLESCVLGLASRLTNEKQIKEFKKLLKSDDNFATFRDAAIETVEHNVAWARRYGDVIGNILTVKRGGNSAVSIMLNKYVMFISLGFISVFLSIFK